MNTFPNLCPTECNGVVTYPAIPADQNCVDYEVDYSEVTDLYITPTGATYPWDAWAVGPVTLVEESIDNTDTANAKTKWLVGRGSVSVPEKVTQEYPKRKDRVTVRTYTLSFTVDNVTDEQYEFGRAVQCGNVGLTFSYATLTHLFGSETGIVPKSVDCDFPLDEGRDGRVRMVFTFTYEAKGDPERRDKPTV